MACSCPPPVGALVPTSDDDTECYGHGLLLRPPPPLRAPLYPPPMMTQSAMDMACSCPPPVGALVPTSDDDTECYGHGLLLPVPPPPAGTLVPTSDDDTECYGHGLLLPLPPPPAGTLVPTSDDDTECYGHGLLLSPPPAAPLYPPPMMTQSAMDMACYCPPPCGTLVPTSDDDTECYGHGLLLSPPPAGALVPTSDYDTECYGHGLLLLGEFKCLDTSDDLPQLINVLLVTVEAVHVLQAHHKVKVTRLNADHLVCVVPVGVHEHPPFQNGS